MATAKLWWNGSEWKSYETNWFSYSSESTSAYYYVRADFRIIAYDDATIAFSGTIWGAPQSNVVVSGTRYISVNGSDVGSFSMSNTHSQSRTFSVSSPTATVRWYGAGSVSCRGTQGNGSPWTSGSGSTTITSPFVTVTYMVNGETYATQTMLKGISTAISATAPTRANHTFLGWATSSSAHVQDYDEDGNVTTSSNLTLYAVWEPCVFISADEGVTITFDGVDYTNETATVGKTWGNEYALSIAPNTGFIIKTQSHPNGDVEIDADEITISATSQRVGCHIDDGEEWVQAVMYLDTGAEWVMVQAYVDDGNEWGLVY